MSYWIVVVYVFLVLPQFFSNVHCDSKQIDTTKDFELTEEYLRYQPRVRNELDVLKNTPNNNVANDDDNEEEIDLYAVDSSNKLNDDDDEINDDDDRSDDEDADAIEILVREKRAAQPDPEPRGGGFRGGFRSRPSVSRKSRPSVSNKQSKSPSVASKKSKKKSKKSSSRNIGVIAVAGATMGGGYQYRNNKNQGGMANANRPKTLMLLVISGMAAYIYCII